MNQIVTYILNVFWKLDVFLLNLIVYCKNKALTQGYNPLYALGPFSFKKNFKNFKKVFSTGKMVSERPC